jgi:hypothetical protein
MKNESGALILVGELAKNLSCAAREPILPPLTKYVKRRLLNEEGTSFNVWNAGSGSFFGNYAANVCR